MNWIKCSDRMPELYDAVIIYEITNNEPYVTTSYLMEDTETGEIQGWHHAHSCGKKDTFFGLHEVTHWMPLPHPPEKDNNPPESLKLEKEAGQFRFWS